ncbi:cupin domain-containing protein [Microbulbifer sp. OS29]|uniref:Cupin domain-containing protein n=1 Tax=Microbulbifer okhotskensis TaxID=2926617 RepID=A0A9X2EN38_9GAMM|nr:cupin domain-containing protein [Microbulbifer okhotskensis]MCO1335302.1 cupin domain-containing protein [Microbulbifer okhotskensis]
MEIVKSKEFLGEKPWASKLIANMDGITIKLHWTNEPYVWHINDGQEVFAVLDGSVEMFYKVGGQTESALLGPGDIFYASAGTEHVAHPIGEARILVIEAEGSI